MESNGTPLDRELKKTASLDENDVLLGSNQPLMTKNCLVT